MENTEQTWVDPSLYAAAVDQMLAWHWEHGTRITELWFTRSGFDPLRASRRRVFKVDGRPVEIQNSVGRWLRSWAGDGLDVDRLMFAGLRSGRRVTRELAYVLPEDVDPAMYAHLRRTSAGTKHAPAVLSAVRRLDA